MNTPTEKLYTFIVDIQDGCTKFRAKFSYPHGDKSVKDLCDAISRELGIAPLDPLAIVCTTTYYNQCPPSPTPSSPPTAPANSAADRSLPAQLQAVLGPERVEQLRRLSTYASEHLYESPLQLLALIDSLSKIVLALVTPTPGTSTSGDTKTP